MQDQPHAQQNGHGTTPQANGERRSEALLAMVAKLVAATPFALATLAMLYDVGWFARIGLDLFPLFSLTEHLVFGMGGIPLLLGALLVMFFVSAIGSIGTPGAREKTQDRFYLYGVSFFIAGGIASMIRYPDAWPAGATLVLVGLLFLFRNLTEGPARVGVLIVGNFVVVTVAAFATGYAMAAAVLNPQEALSWLATSPTTISLTDGPPISGRVLRSSDRGLLVFDALDGTIQFKRWDEVRGIDVSPGAKIVPRR